MDHYERQEKKREAMRRMRAQHRRTGDLRRRVVATSVVAFALLWAIVFAQMATGNDPVLSGKSAAVATTSGSHRKGRAAKSEASGGSGAGEHANGGSANEASETEGAAVEPAPVEAEIEAIEAEIEAEAEAEGFEAEPEAEAVEAEPEVEEFVEEPAPVTTSQS